MKTQKRTFLILSLVGALVLSLVAVPGSEGQSAVPPAPSDQGNANLPPVEQALIPEGVFAAQLAEALKMGQSLDEAQAESMLSAAGIEPKNGWIAGYPVTPPVLSEIEKAIAAAADAGKLGMGREQALKATGDLKAKLGLNVTAGPPPQFPAQAASSNQPVSTFIYKYTDKSGVIHYTDQYGSIPKEYRDQVEMIREYAHTPPAEAPAPQAAPQETEPPVDQASSYTVNPAPEVINNYYYNDGPPVITYYEPPQPYAYLYSWVPYPFWCSGFFFPGYFILHDFHRHVSFHKHPFVVTNHVVVGKGGARNAFVVDPVSRSFRGGKGANHPASSQFFNSPGVQSSARAIVGLNQRGVIPPNVSTAPGRNSGAPASVSRPQVQAPPSRSPNTHMAMPSPTQNRRVTARSSGMGSSVTAGSVSGRPGAGGTNNDVKMRADRPKVRTFNQPPRPIQGSFSAQPSNGTGGDQARNPVNVTRVTVSRGERTEERGLGMAGNGGNRNEMNFQPQHSFEPRTFNPPAPPAAGERFFAPVQRGQVFSPPSTSQSRAFSTPSTGGRGFGGFHGGGGFTGHGGSLGSGFGGRR